MASTAQTSSSAFLKPNSCRCRSPASSARAPARGKKLPAPAGIGACGAATIPNRSLAPTKHWSRRDTVVKGVGLLVLQDKIVCQGFAGGSLADAGKKTSCKDGKRRRKKNAPREGALAQETKSSSSAKGTAKQRQMSTAQVKQHHILP